KYQLAKQRYNEAIASLNNPENTYHIDLTQLVKLKLDETRLLPVRSGVYFVVDSDFKIYYIGSSKNIMLRWNYQGQSHHRMSQFEQINLTNPLYILSYPCDNYQEEEEHAIAYFKPLLNGTKQ
ncbi:MAG: GIY-YIG nuclease family protein, partial [Microcoleaceae cyanobacterium]